MSIIVSFADYTPPVRFDGIPWATARIEEAVELDLGWFPIDTVLFSPLDSDPSRPASRSFTTSNGTDVNLWYRVVFADTQTSESLPTAPLQNRDVVAYATVDALAEKLHVRVPDHEGDLTRVLEAAASEIDAELGRSEAFTVVPALVTEVNIERAVEHWQQMKSPFGILGLGAEAGATYTAHDSWDRHAHKLAPLKASWGFA